MSTQLSPQQTPTSGTLDFATRIGLLGDELKKLSSALKQATKPGAKRAKTVELLERTKRVLANCVNVEKECGDALVRYRDVTDREWSELDARIKEMCAKHQWRIDGSWPSYIAAYGLQLDFDPKTKMVSVGGIKYPGNDLSAIETKLSTEVKKLLPATFAPDQFLEDLASAYEDAKRGSLQAPILDVYKALVVRSQRPGFWRNAKNDRFVGLTIEQFRARISKTLEANVLKTKDGRELRFYPPLDPKDAVFLFNPLERRLGFVGRIEFSGNPL